MKLEDPSAYVRELCLALAEADTATSALAWFSLPLEDLAEWTDSLIKRRKEQERRSRSRKGK